jgi:hypothetical protein
MTKPNVHTKGFGLRIAGADVPGNGGFEVARTAMDAAADLFFGEGREPAFDEVDRRGTRRREMDVKARMPGQPPVDDWCLVRAVVVHDQVDVEIGRHRRVDRIEKLATLDCTVSPMEFPDDRAAPYVQRGEERGGPCRV